jgi:hypothetical protein
LLGHLHRLDVAHHRRPPGEQNGRWYHSEVCRRCAGADPKLRTGHHYCDVADMIDVLMQAAPDRWSRELLAVQLKSTTDHFAAWRWPEDADNR